MSNLFDVKGKVVAITGGGGVLCGGIAEYLAACGTKVAVMDLKLDAAEEVVRRIVAAGGIATAINANVLQRDSLEAAHKQCVETLGSVDVLINGAGGNHPAATTGPDKKFFDLPIDAF